MYNQVASERVFIALKNFYVPSFDPSVSGLMI